MLKQSKSAFTLIELLVAVAIIAILAAIAIPNFRAAQQRSKIARVASDLRTLATALEAYAVNEGAYPGCNAWGVAGARLSQPTDPPVLERLSTPVAYMGDALIQSPYRSDRYSGRFLLGVGPVHTAIEEWPQQVLDGPERPLYSSYFYTAVGADSETVTGLNRARIDVVRPDRLKASAYILQSPGPSRALINMGGVVPNAHQDYAAQLVYDPTNGSQSFGNIFRAGGQVDGVDNIVTYLTAKSLQGK